MTSFVPGDNTPWLEVTQVSQNGIWLLVDNEEFFLPYDAYPKFRESTVHRLFNVERDGSTHVYWPDLEIRVSLDSLRHEMQQALPTY